MPRSLAHGELRRAPWKVAVVPAAVVHSGSEWPTALFALLRTSLTSSRDAVRPMRSERGGTGRLRRSWATPSTPNRNRRVPPNYRRLILRTAVFSEASVHSALLLSYSRGLSTRAPGMSASNFATCCSGGSLMIRWPYFKMVPTN